MRVALVHDYIKEYGGAERVLEALHELYPDAPVFTTVFLPEFLGPHEERFRDWDIRTSIAQLLPFKERLISLLRMIAPLLFKQFDFSGFDVVIVSATGAYTPNAIKVKSQKSKLGDPIHITYCHTPPRYLYGYATAREWKKSLIVRTIGEIVNHVLRLVDYYSSKNVDFFIANSINVQKRIEKFYRRDSVVIYPPVDTNVSSSKYQVVSKTKDTKYMLHTTGYFLAGGRLARPKHIDLIVEACAELELPLIVFGRAFAGYELELKTQNAKVKSAIQNSKIKFAGEIDEEEKYNLMNRAKAFIFAAEDEDFGITPVEAMAAGTPVIAYRSGGVVESVTSSGRGATGVFFDELTVESLSKAIQSFGKLRINADDCIRQAQKFSKERFKTEIQLFVDKVFRMSS